MMNQNASSASHRVIAFLTDFGLADGYVGVMKGVVLNIVPDAQIIDITHDIPPQQIVSGAWILGISYRYFPEGTVFICVVDPGVGSKRRPIAIHAGKWFFVGPDNGLFGYVLEQHPAREVVELTNPAYRLPQTSTTFHGRDVFSPAGAYIARGVPLAELGPRLAPAALERVNVLHPRREGARIVGQVIHVDHFGNLVTDISLHEVPDLFNRPVIELSFPARGMTISERRHFFSEIAQNELNEARPFIYVDSSGYIGVAVRNGNAARALGVSYGEPVEILTEQHK